MPLERELKFSVLDAYVPSLSELRAALEGTPYEVQAAPLQEIEDRYFDDEVRSLRSAGVALPSRTTAPAIWARSRARSRAW